MAILMLVSGSYVNGCVPPIFWKSFSRNDISVFIMYDGEE